MGPGFRRRVVGAPGGPLPGLLHDDRADAARDRRLVREDADDVGAAPDLGIRPPDEVRAVRLGAVPGGEGRVGEHILLCAVHQGRI